MGYAIPLWTPPSLPVEGTGDQVGVSIWSYVYGDDRHAIAERDEPRWRDWLAARTAAG